MSSLTVDQVALQLDSLAGWQQDGNSLVKVFEFMDFASAIAFMTHSAFYAEQLEHHPKWENYHNIVSVRIGDSEQGAVQSRDVQLAKRLQAVAEKL
ncbi:MAG: 4a-hydroxytetrahydrobiopterin dehydratase [Moraxella sp.]|nr:4a-hydroxytetrahydrobiopterin dehydratase [Moraxella sp.]